MYSVVGEAGKRVRPYCGLIAVGALGIVPPGFTQIEWVCGLWHCRGRIAIESAIAQSMAVRLGSGNATVADRASVRSVIEGIPFERAYNDEQHAEAVADAEAQLIKTLGR